MAKSVLFFAVYAFAGWMLETVYASWRQGKWVNRGFLKGWFCPIYGFGAILILGLSQWIHDLGWGAVWSNVVLWGTAVIVVTLLEYVTGWALVKKFHRKWWDYSDMKFNLDGHICLGYSLLWGTLALFLAEYLHPFVESRIGLLTSQAAQAAMWLLLFYFVADFCLSVKEALIERGPLPFSTAELLRLDEYEECVRELLEHDEVQGMEQFIHHHKTNRLHHSIQVSFTSYMACRLLGFDYRSAARGALLHDFFQYDWREDRTDGRLHAFSHPHEALENANRLFSLNKVEQDIIVKHMWPLTLALPRYKETVVVLLADKYCTLKEYVVWLRDRRAEARAAVGTEPQDEWQEEGSYKVL